MPKRWYFETWLPFWDVEKKILPAFLLGTLALLARLSVYSIVALGIFLLARKYGDPVWNQHKIKVLTVERDSLQTVVKDTVATKEAEKAAIKQEKNQEVKALVSVLANPNAEVVKVQVGDTTVATVKIKPDTVRKDSAKRDSVHP
ncbi:hypothetical protein BWI93_27215 [Siphonobacter sp. BAB-5385]|uniref:hypothetical protein n=1 Tax=Siphonobacter sp. BAB-5385 TaxID=1864822 RepID=UPI000B9E41E7|nr:hypothetical protein [Siphonobacter sp. BAB-5385]OZI05106.1 hypothetical protein BWI93_27215 [Siphonobacter sp. BAB-5385]